MGFSDEESSAILWPNEYEVSVIKLVKSGNCTLITSIFQYISDREKQLFFSVIDPQYYIDDLCLIFPYSTDIQKDFLIKVINSLDENDCYDMSLSTKASVIIDIFSQTNSDKLFKAIAKIENIREQILTIAFSAKYFNLAQREIASAIFSQIDLPKFKAAIDQIPIQYKSELINMAMFFSHEQKAAIKDYLQCKKSAEMTLCR